MFCTILIIWLLFNPPGGQADNGIHPTQKMLMHGLSVAAYSDGTRYELMKLQNKGISYLPEDTFMDFPNITVGCNAYMRTGISNYIPQFTVGCNYLSLPEILASGDKVLIWSQVYNYLHILTDQSKKQIWTQSNLLIIWSFLSKMWTKDTPHLAHESDIAVCYLLISFRFNRWGLWHQKQVYQAGISNYIPQ